MLIGGLKVIVSAWAVHVKPPLTVRLTWRERILSWPWRPWRATKSVHVPDEPAAFMFKDHILIHPHLMASLKAEGLITREFYKSEAP